MRRALSIFFHRPAIKPGLARDAGGRFRNPRFVSFLAANNRRTIDTNLQDAMLRGRKVMKQVLVVALAAGAAWFVVESARAFSVF